MRNTFKPRRGDIIIAKSEIKPNTQNNEKENYCRELENEQVISGC